MNRRAKEKEESIRCARWREVERSHVEEAKAETRASRKAGSGTHKGNIYYIIVLLYSIDQLLPA
jgi:hypothetical protein